MERLAEDDNVYYEEELMVARAKTGDKKAQEFIIKRYKNFVRSRARSYFLIGADREDIVQEGMIGLFKAIRDYQPNKMSSFRSFADLCVKRQIITAIKTATRQKHMPLNSYISLNKPLYDEESDRTLYDMMVNNKELNPEHLIIKQEEWHLMALQMGKVLSDLEWQVLSAYIDGKSYQEIAVDMNRHIKSIDNALQRVKKKLEKFVDKE